jgi:RNA polymerase sigma-70 factor (ECF subfamily)
LLPENVKPYPVSVAAPLRSNLNFPQKIQIGERAMLKISNPYTLRLEESEGVTRYFVLFKDGQAIPHEVEVSFTLYQEFDAFRRDEKRQQTSFGRHIEHSELLDGTLYDRAFRKPESVDDIVIKRGRMETYRRAVAELPDIQRRRFVLYYEDGLTYRAIGAMESCSATSIKSSVEIARAKIIKKLQV